MPKEQKSKNGVDSRASSSTYKRAKAERNGGTSVKLRSPGITALLQAAPEIASLKLGEAEVCSYAAQKIEHLKSENEKLKNEVREKEAESWKEKMQYSEHLLKANLKVSSLEALLQNKAKVERSKNEEIPLDSASADYTHLVHYESFQNRCLVCGQEAAKKN